MGWRDLSELEAHGESGSGRQDSLMKKQKGTVQGHPRQLREGNLMLMLRGEKHLEEYKIYFAQATSNPAFLYLLKLHDSILKPPPFCF